MSRAEELSAGRDISGQQAEMQKLFVKGHLLIGADVSAIHINDFLVGLGEVCGMNIFDGPHVKTPDFYDLDTFRRLGNRPPEDINGSVMWDDSGAQIYVFPNNRNWFTLDIYTCRRFDPQTALSYTYQQLGVREDMMYSTQDAQENTDWRQFVLPNGKILNPESRFLPRIDQLFDVDYSDPDQLIRSGSLLRETIHEAVRESCGTRVAASYTKDQIRELREIHGRWEVAVDHRFIDDVLSGKVNSPDQYLLQPTYDRLSFMEATAAGMIGRRRVLHIGTGWPGTAIGLYRQFGIPVTCVEKDLEFAERSKKGLEKLGLLSKDQLQVVCADGCELNTEGYQAVIVSAMVPDEDKRKIIRNMRELASGDVSDPVLVFRAPVDQARSLFYQGLSQEITGDQWLTLISDTSQLIGESDPLRSMVFRVGEMAEIRRGSDRLLVSAIDRLQQVGNVAA